MARLTAEDRRENARRRREAGVRLAEMLAKAEPEQQWGRLLTGVELQAGRAVRTIEVQEVTRK
jgi:hypothetical protein